MLYKFLVVILGPIIKFIFRVEIINNEILENNKGYVLAGNHIKWTDPVILALSTNRVIHFISKDSLNKGLHKYLFKALHIIPVDRVNKNNKESIEKAVHVLKEDKLLGIFPEGTRNKTEEDLLPFKVGASKMAYESKCEIIPFYISASLFKKPKLIFGEPIKPSSNLEDTTNKLREEVLKLKE